MGTLLVILLLTVPGMAADCGKNCYEISKNNCACDMAPNFGPEIIPSDEKPPRSGRTVTDGAMPQSLIYQDAKMDQDRLEADAAGKRAAGIP